MTHTKLQHTKCKIRALWERTCYLAKEYFCCAKLCAASTTLTCISTPWLPVLAITQLWRLGDHLSWSLRHSNLLPVLSVHVLDPARLAREEQDAKMLTFSWSLHKCSNVYSTQQFGLVLVMMARLMTLLPWTTTISPGFPSQIFWYSLSYFESMEKDYIHFDIIMRYLWQLHIHCMFITWASHDHHTTTTLLSHDYHMTII